MDSIWQYALRAMCVPGFSTTVGAAGDVSVMNAHWLKSSFPECVSWTLFAIVKTAFPSLGRKWISLRSIWRPYWGVSNRWENSRLHCIDCTHVYFCIEFVKVSSSTPCDWFHPFFSCNAWHTYMYVHVCTTVHAGLIWLMNMSAQFCQHNYNCK